jgi:hypothetical protein
MVRQAYLGILRDGGEGATTPEWQLSSPPPFHQFERLRRID